MEPFLSILESFMPAFLTFGPLFMIMRGTKGDTRTPRERWMNYVGVFMVGIALVALWLQGNHQRNRIQLLEMRLAQLKSSSR